MLAPALVLLLASLYPFLTGIYTGLTNKKLYLPEAEFIGLGNFQTLAGHPSSGRPLQTPSSTPSWPC